MLSNEQLALLASIYYEQTVVDAIGRVYTVITPEITDFVDRGLVTVQKSFSLALDGGDYQEAVVTQEGMLSLEEHGNECIVQALLAMKDYITLEYFVSILPIRSLPQFLISNVAFIRGAARERYEELNDSMARSE